MKRISHFFLITKITIGFWLIQTMAHAQNVGINSTGAAPHTSAMLDILSTNKGLLIPRVALTGTDDVATISSPATSLMVYNTATAGISPTDVFPGFYYWDGSQWVAFGGTGGRDWSLLGNAGTTDGINFLGTTDNVALNFRVNNNKAGRIEPAGGTFLGYQAGNSDIMGTNTGIGYQALFSNVDGNSNTASGYQALYSNISGFNNVATGYQALYSNTAFQNVATGYQALYTNTTGNENVATGYQALYSNTIGSQNIATGSQALYFNTTGNSNVATGYQALYSNTTGSLNVATGNQALYSNTVGINNVASGSQALYSNTTGNNNVVTGSQALYFNRTGSNNTISGYQAAYGVSSSSSSNNTILGYRAGYSLSSGSNNVFLGYQAGDAVTTGANNIVIGYDIDAPSNTGSNQMTIGNLIFGTGLGATGTTVSTGSVGIGKSAPAYVLDVVGDINSSTNVRAAGVILTSDARLKKNIVNLNAGTETIMKLRPVSYQKKESMEATEYTKNEIGFIAQEVQKVLPQLVYEGKDKDKILALDYNSLIPILTKAIQEQQAQIGQCDNLEKKDYELLKIDNESLKKENDALKAGMDKLKKQQEEILHLLGKSK